MEMPTKLIRLEDGSLVEVKASVEEAERISGGRTAQKVQSSFDKITPLLKQVATATAKTWNNLSEDVAVEQAEIEVGLSFEGEGNLYITKSKAGANLKVKLIIKKKP